MYIIKLLDTEVAAADKKVEAEPGQAHHIAVVVGSRAVVVVAADNGIPHHFFCTIPVWHWDSYTSESGG